MLAIWSCNQGGSDPMVRADDAWHPDLRDLQADPLLWLRLQGRQRQGR